VSASRTSTIPTGLAVSVENMQRFFVSGFFDDLGDFGSSLMFILRGRRRPVNDVMVLVLSQNVQNKKMIHTTI
jgi:hypothetical protein